MSVTYGLCYARPEMMGAITVDDGPQGSVWLDVIEYGFVVVAFLFFAAFADQQSLASFIVAFIATLAMTR